MMINNIILITSIMFVLFHITGSFFMYIFFLQLIGITVNIMMFIISMMLNIELLVFIIYL